MKNICAFMLMLLGSPAVLAAGKLEIYVLRASQKD